MARRKQVTSESITYVISALLRLALLLAALLAVITASWTVLFASLGALILSYVPRALASRIQVRLPLQFEAFIVVFLYATLFLGEVGDYYYRFWWWDVVLHVGSAFAFGFVGFLILFTLQARGKITASPFLISVFAFSFAVAIGVMWEIFEFFMDSVFGLNMQKSGLQDTMWDLIVDTIGAATAATIGYVHLRHDMSAPYEPYIKWFMNANPRFKQRLKKIKRS